VEVRLANGEKIQGAMGEQSEEDFLVWFHDATSVASRSIDYGEVNSIKILRDDGALRRRLVRHLVLVGVIAGVILLAASSLK
jgi:hypothetical protein